MSAEARSVPNRISVWIAARDLASEPLLSLFAVLSLSAVLAPLLILFSLKFGLIDTIASRLIEDVRNREIVVLTSGRFDRDWFEEVSARPDVAFLVPSTRVIAASFNALQHRPERETLRGVTMIPTLPGDPLLDSLQTEIERPDEIILSAVAAERLRAGPGDVLRARIQRTRENTAEAVFAELTVVDVAPHWAHPTPGAFVSLDLQVATEDYRDGFGAPEFGWPGEAQTGERLFPRFRLYARSIYDVAELRDFLAAEGVDVRTQAATIEAMRSLDRNLSLVFGLVAAVAITGFAAAFSANLASNVERKRRELSVLRLVGAPLRVIVVFPLAQALMVAAGGLMVSFALFAAVSRQLNVIFADSARAGEFVSRLTPEHVLAASLFTFAVAALSAIWAGVAGIRIEPTEGLSHV